MMAEYAMYVVVAIVAIAAFALNPGLAGLGYAVLVVVGAGTIWVLRTLYLNEADHQDRE